MAKFHFPNGEVLTCAAKDAAKLARIHVRFNGAKVEGNAEELAMILAANEGEPFGLHPDGTFPAPAPAPAPGHPVALSAPPPAAGGTDAAPGADAPPAAGGTDAPPAAGGTDAPPPPKLPTVQEVIEMPSKAVILHAAKLHFGVDLQGNSDACREQLMKLVKDKQAALEKEQAAPQQ